MLADAQMGQMLVMLTLGHFFAKREGNVAWAQ